MGSHKHIDNKLTHTVTKIRI